MNKAYKESVLLRALQNMKNNYRGFTEEEISFMYEVVDDYITNKRVVDQSELMAWKSAYYEVEAENSVLRKKILEMRED